MSLIFCRDVDILPSICKPSQLWLLKSLDSEEISCLRNKQLDSCYSVIDSLVVTSNENKYIEKVMLNGYLKGSI